MRKRREVYSISLWGSSVKISFTEHSLERLKDRTSLTALDILKSLQAAEQKIKKLRGKQKRFVVFDYVLNTAYMAVFDSPDKIAVITIFKTAAPWVEGGPDIIIRTKKELRRYISV